MNAGDEWAAFAAWAEEWNAEARKAPAYKSGKPKPRKKRPIDALAVVRVGGLSAPLWNEETRQRTIRQLLDEEEERRAKGELDQE